MSQLTPEIAADVVAACGEGAEEAAGALSRALDGEFQLEVGEPSTFSAESAPEGFDGAGLVVKLVLGEEAAVAVLPATAGMTPDWCAEPDATGLSKLATLAQELGMLLLPESLMAEDFATAWVTDIAGRLAEGGVADGASCVPLTMVAGEQRGDLTLLWPATKVAELLASPADDASPGEATAEETAEPPPATPAATLPSEPALPHPTRIVQDFHDLPNYARSLLSIKLPLMVTLAEKQEDISEIVDLGPGSILTFEKPCDDPLTIEVGGQPVGTGEAVKVGEKFGVRVVQMTLPGEKFDSVKPAQRPSA